MKFNQTEQVYPAGDRDSHRLLNQVADNLDLSPNS
jgi:hypothetical protein